MSDGSLVETLKSFAAYDVINERFKICRVAALTYFSSAKLPSFISSQACLDDVNAISVRVRRKIVSALIAAWSIKWQIANVRSRIRAGASTERSCSFPTISISRSLLDRDARTIVGTKDDLSRRRAYTISTVRLAQARAVSFPPEDANHHRDLRDVRGVASE